MPKVISNLDNHYSKHELVRLLTELQVDVSKHMSFNKLTVEEFDTQRDRSIGAIVHEIVSHVDQHSVPTGEVTCVPKPLMQVTRKSGYGGEAEVHSKITTEGHARKGQITLNTYQSAEYINPHADDFLPVYSFDHAVDGIPLEKRLSDTVKLVRKSHPHIKCAVPPFDGDSYDDRMIIDAYSLWAQYQSAFHGDAHFQGWLDSPELKQLEAHRRGWFNAYFVTCVRLYDPVNKFYIGQLGFNDTAYRNSNLVYVCPRTQRERGVYEYRGLPHVGERTSAGNFAAESKYPDRMATVIKKTHVAGLISDTEIVKLCVNSINNYDELRQQLNQQGEASAEVARRSAGRLHYDVGSRDLMGYLLDTIVHNGETPSLWKSPPAKLVKLVEAYEEKLKEAQGEEKDALGLVPMFIVKPRQSVDLYYVVAPHHISWDNPNPRTSPVKKKTWDTIYRASPEAQVALPDEISNKISAVTMAARTNDGTCELPCVGMRSYDTKIWDTPSPNRPMRLAEGVWGICVSVETAQACHAIGEVVWTR